jgi:hypothetical protein
MVKISDTFFKNCSYLELRTRAATAGVAANQRRKELRLTRSKVAELWSDVFDRKISIRDIQTFEEGQRPKPWAIREYALILETKPAALLGFVTPEYRGIERAYEQFYEAEYAGLIGVDS